MRSEFPIIYTLSGEGKSPKRLPDCDVPSGGIETLIPDSLIAEKPPALPEVSEIELVRHFTGLSRRNHGVDNGFYPLGSCTMKYNPKVNEAAANLKGFTGVHPLADEASAQGCLEVMYRLQNALIEITGMDGINLQPAAGAHGELLGLMLIKAYHEDRGDTKRNVIIVPDSAHGTNPASAAGAGFVTKEIASAADGTVDLDALRAAVGENTAGLMLTNPNTLGIFEYNIAEIADIVHGAGGLLYYDGANLNAIMGKARPGDMGFDVVHLNLHKTFSTPHGGGGPGSGPVGVKEKLLPYMPTPYVTFDGDVYSLKYDIEKSIGSVKSFYGNFGVMVKALCYIMALGGEGLTHASEQAVLAANYVAQSLKGEYNLPHGNGIMHEFVLSAENLLQYGVHAMDVAKALIDKGFHPPTVYFPLIVKEALMIEPTETESKADLDRFIEAMKDISSLAKTKPEKLHEAPVTTPCGRLDETAAARKPVVRYKGLE